MFLSFLPLACYAYTRVPDTSLPAGPHCFNLSCDHDKPVDLSNFLWAFEDSSRTLEIENVSSPDYKGRYHTNNFDRKSWQDQSFVIWARLCIKNSSGKTRQIYLSGGFGDTIVIYRQNGEQSFDKRITGMLVPLVRNGNTLIPHADFNYTIEKDEECVFYIRLSQDDYMWLPPKIPLLMFTSDAIGPFQNQLHVSWTLNGLYFGMVLFMFIYALALLVIFRERTYLWLALFQMANCLYFLDDTGIGFSLLYPSLPVLFKYGSTIIFWALLLMHFLFITSYLDIRKHFARTYNVLLVITLIAAFSRFVFWGFGYFQLGRYIEDIGLFVMIILLFIVVFYMAFILGMKQARIMLLGEISVAVAGMITSLTFSQIIDLPSHFAMNILQLGFALQMLLWTVAIVDKIVVVRKEKEMAQARALEIALANEQLIRDQNVVLGNKVEERTRRLKETQSQLIQSEKLASLGLLTAGIAHEINDPLDLINTGIKGLQKDYEDLNKIVQSVGILPEGSKQLADELEMNELLKIIPGTIADIKTGVERTSEIMQGLRNFTRLDVSDLKEADIHDGLDSTLLLLSHKFKDRICIIKNYDKRIGLIKCYPGPLNQVFMNMLNNAIDAITQKIKDDQSGKLTYGDHFQIEITTKLITVAEQNKVEISIRDNGTGIRAEIMDNLFDPFFTTKDVGKGTGLGLSICHGIIEKHGGFITVQSKLKEWTIFTVTLPVT